MATQMHSLHPVKPDRFFHPYYLEESVHSSFKGCQVDISSLVT